MLNHVICIAAESIEACKRNIQFNGSMASSKVETHLADARVYMLTHPKEFYAVTLDPCKLLVLSSSLLKFCSKRCGTETWGYSIAKIKEIILYCAYSSLYLIYFRKKDYLWTFCLL